MLPPVRLLVTGGSGYLGGELLRRARAVGWAAIGTRLSAPGDGPVLDVRDVDAVARLVGREAPDAVIHTAYVQSGPAMDDVNVAGSANVARAAAAAGARLIHLSTDVVFDGEKVGAYSEDDPPAPVTAYGASKRAAEHAVAEADPRALIVRTSLLYGGPRPAPHERLVADAIAGTADVGFFTDELRCPVVVGELASALLELLATDLRGPLHVAGEQTLSRFELACLLADAAGLDRSRLRPASSADLPERRPRNCALDCSRARALLRTKLRGAGEVLGAATGPIYTRQRWPRP